MEHEKKMKVWICETTCIATKTVLVEATSRKEALRKLKDDSPAEGTDVHYGPERVHRVIRQDGK